jgi:hypothetical protein
MLEFVPVQCHCDPLMCRFNLHHGYYACVNRPTTIISFLSIVHTHPRQLVNNMASIIFYSKTLISFDRMVIAST